MLQSIKGIIFDYGGTLDTQGVHWFHIFREAYAQYLPEVAEAQLREAYVYAERYLATHRVIEPADDFLAMLQKKVGIQLEALNVENATLIAHIATYCDELVRRNMQHTREVLERLSAHYPLVLVSNFYGNIHSVLRSYGIEHYFSAVIESAVVGIRKPDARIFALGVEALDLSPTAVLVVGDSYDKDIVPAHSLGCRTVWLKGQGWNTAEEDTQECCADRIINELQEIIS